MGTSPSVAPLAFTLKVATRCNLNCSYCYVYNKGDTSWRSRPRVMPDGVFSATLERIRQHCVTSGQPAARITFHGGEPCLMGPDRLEKWCREAHTRLDDLVRVQFSIQTNGTLLNDRWIQVFKDCDVEVGVSMDGPKEIHDVFRVDHRGRGSFEQVRQGLDLLKDGKIPFGVLCVIPLGFDGLTVHRSLVELGVTWINYLLPQFTHDTIGSVRARYGPSPCADFLVPILNEWWSSNPMEVRIRLFWDIASLIMGGASRSDALGNRPLQFVFVETDGAIEGLDVLRVCQDGIANTGLNVETHDFAQVAELSPLHGEVIFNRLPVPTQCRQCHEVRTCAGGYLPHRFARTNGFDNPSVWCQDLLRIFGRLRELLGVSVEESDLRRRVLMEMSAGFAEVSRRPVNA